MAGAHASDVQGIGRRYGFDPQPGGVHQLLVDRVPPRSAVLDVGCASGYIGAALAPKGCRVWGVDAMEAAVASVPASAYEDVLTADLDALTRLPWEGQRFDVIVAADVLEHLRDPRRVIDVLVGSLADDGI